MDTEKFHKEILNSKDVKKHLAKKKLAYEIADMVVDARAKMGITQSELAKKVGTKQPSIARIEAGEKLPSLTFLEKIAQALGTTLFIVSLKQGTSKNFKNAVKTTRRFNKKIMIRG